MWKKAGPLICRHPLLIAAAALALAFPAALAALKTPVNYDIFSYMPDTVSSIKGQQILEEEYNAAAAGFALLEKRDTAELLRIKKELASVDGVSRVIWLRDIVDPAVPESFIPSEILEIFQKEDSVLFCMLFSEPAGSEKSMNAVRKISSLLSGAGVKAFTGLPALLRDLTRVVNKEKTRAVIAAVIISGLVVGIAMRSWLIPLVFLFSIGISIVWNMGTNFLQGSISYVTEAVAVVIQLGVTFDFSIFLAHRFQEELQAETCLPQDAMINAINRTFRAVAPAALTTITGFLALGLMDIRIGLDMGLVMAKGVFLGLIASLTLLPALLLLSSPWLPAVRKQPAGNAGDRKKVSLPVRRRRLFFLLLILLFLPAVYGRYHTDLSYSIKAMLPADLPSVKAMETINSVMGQGDTASVLLPGKTPRRVLAGVTREIERLPGVNRALSLGTLADPAVPRDFVPQKLEHIFSRGGHTQVIVLLGAQLGTDAADKAVEEMRKILAAHGPGRALVTGTSAVTRDLISLSRHDIPVVNAASLAGILLIVAVIFRSVSIPAILVACIQLAIYINLAIPFYTGQTIPFLTFTAISAIQLGTTVDYAILLMTRYQEERSIYPAVQAMSSALRGSAPAVIVSGLSLFSATIGMVFISRVETISSMALMIGRGALISMAVILLLAPAAAAVCDRLIVYTSAGWKNPEKRGNAACGSGRFVFWLSC